jgi:hypothetical protein
LQQALLRHSVQPKAQQTRAKPVAAIVATFQHPTIQ